MNDQIRKLPADALRLALLALAVVVIVEGLDNLIAALGIGAFILFFAGWDVARTRAAARSLARSVVGD
jgi:hypothetical protein